ncbi:DSD1 family PLP-dependent enzyme [Rhodobacter ferrooxidans]|uniref:Alanine racemase domain protein n=1 Tax=Rhodobacter ferrooxidans TaxID=371731 RepID=C8S287_9RHOB|nr:DSD1 family PLP-dependent enzyme [Rhodobacter sp. SW2]EEW24959.1 alanine racemase domain protein [Rhodobacter sp. SW2]
MTALEVGYDIPATPGMTEAEVQTPSLILDLDALEANIASMQSQADAAGVRLRVHGKMHKSAEIAQMQIAAGACGICCQKVSEAEAFARAGLRDILITNQVRGAVKTDRLARLPLLGARILTCVDDPANVAELSAAAQRHGTEIEVLVEIDCGAGRCGVAPDQAPGLAQAIVAAPGLRFAGLQAYQGSAQHQADPVARRGLIETAIAATRRAVDLLAADGQPCAIIGGAGTGSYRFEAASGVYNELQCGSYAFMDADYRRVLGEGAFRHSLFVLTTVMSHVKPDHAVVDAGLKVMSLDSGLPQVAGRSDVTYVAASDEHGELADPTSALRVGTQLRLIPGHCDPTCNLHEWYVGIRNGVVERLIPVTARGKSF